MTIKSIPEAIAEVKPEQGEQFSPSRYPYTYACDYLRNHPEIVPAEVWNDPKNWAARDEPLMSGSQASGVRQTWAQLTGEDDADAALVLAEAYLNEHHIEAPAEVRQERKEGATVEWAAEFANDDGSVMLRCDRALDPAAAQVRVDEEIARGDEGARVVRREVREFPDGSRLIGPWVAAEPAAGVS